MTLLRLNPAGRDLRILLVEDDEGDYAFLRDVLGETDLPRHDLEWVSTYEAALSAARDGRHDLYLLDHGLGQRTGEFLLEEPVFRSAAAPTILLTGPGEPDADERALEAGASDFLRKDEIDARTLERAIRYSLQRKRTETRQRFLSEATRLINASLEYDTTVGVVPRVVVPELADWSCLYMPAAEERFRMAEVVHADPDREDAGARISRLAMERAPSPPVRAAMDGGDPIILPEIGADDVETWFDDPEQRELIRKMGAASAILVPLHGKAGVLGVLVVVSSTEGRRYREEDVPFFRELGSRVTMGLENARLFETAREAARIRDELMSMVSHDLGNPLAAISIAAGRIEQLLERGEEQGISRFTGMIRSATSSMERLLEDLLEVGRLETGHFGLRRTAREVTDILELAEQRFAPEAEARDIDLHVDGGEVLPDVLVDLDRVLQVLSNLLDNALKFTDPGGSIRLVARAEEGYVTLSVSDSGSGMSEEELDHLFDRFWQSRRHRRAGAGLGLTISKEIVEAHGGEIHASCVEGEGSTFVFTLPVAETTNP